MEGTNGNSGGRATLVDTDLSADESGIDPVNRIERQLSAIRKELAAVSRRTVHLQRQDKPPRRWRTFLTVAVLVLSLAGCVTLAVFATRNDQASQAQFNLANGQEGAAQLQLIHAADAVERRTAVEAAVEARTRADEIRLAARNDRRWSVFAGLMAAGVSGALISLVVAEMLNLGRFGRRDVQRDLWIE